MCGSPCCRRPPTSEDLLLHVIGSCEARSSEVVCQFVDGHGSDEERCRELSGCERRTNKAQRMQVMTCFCLIWTDFEAFQAFPILISCSGVDLRQGERSHESHVVA